MTIADATPECSLQISTQTLSTWRAGGLPAKEADALAEHVGECASCQAHLAAYDEIDALLRVQTLPQGLMGNWEPLRARLRERPPQRILSLSLPANARLLAAVAVMLLVVIGFTLVFHAGIGQRVSTSSTATISTTPPATPSLTPFSYGQPAHPLTWRQVTLPSDVSSNADLNPSSFAVAPSDAASVYLWGPPATVPGNELNDARSWSLWATHDSASHWTRMATPPVTEAGVGMLLVDKLNASVLLAEVFVFDHPIGDHVAQRFVSRDGGATWQSRNFAMRTNVAEIATWNGASFGLIGDARPSHDGAESSAIPFARSDDGLRTWRAIDQPILATGQWVTKFWVNSRTGAILARTNQAWLWETRDLGEHWTRLPEASSPYVQYIVQDAPSSNLWHICGFVSDGSSAPPILKCSEDSGKTWVDRADISISIPCPICARGKPGYAQGSATLVGIASDGAVIVTDLGGLTSDYQTITALYRLEPGAMKWQSLGIIPNSSAHLYPFLTQGHTIWMVSEDSTGVFVAAYP